MNNVSKIAFQSALVMLISASATAATVFSLSCPSAMALEEVEDASPNFTGVADYYADYFHGKRTASGQLHDKKKLTAAHRTLPFGTKVKLVNRRNKKSCIVVINDRGPFTKNKVIDVSQEAARKLGLFSGTRMVDCYIMETP